MMTRRLGPLAAVAACTALSACFFSERPLFDASDAATPFADGAQFVLRRSDANRDEVVAYEHDGFLYRVGPVEGDETRTEMLFIDIPETPEQDFIAQLSLEPSDDDGRLYAFFWRTEAGFRILASDSVFADGRPGWLAFQTACGMHQLSGCRFATADAVRAFYRDAVYPVFVTGGATPADYTDQIPLTDAERGRPEAR